jgi:hypothetical protein
MELISHAIVKSVQHLVDDDMKIWTTGAGAFASGAMTATLALNVTGRSHGTICPAHAMSLNDLRTELANTQLNWTIEEP